MQVFVAGNIVASLFLGYSASVLYSMINSLQITAHLPLNSISFTNNAMETFDFLISIVTFDYYEVADHIDFGFSESEAWTYRFEMLDYGSFNLIENLGSISIFIALNFLWILIAVMILLIGMCVSCRLRYKWMVKAKERFKMTYVI